MLKDSGQEEPFDIVDLSESGVRIKCGTALAAMTRIRVALVLPGERVGRDEEARVDTMGVVVWSHRIDENRYDTGVFFPELNDESRGLLQAYVLSAV